MIIVLIFSDSAIEDALDDDLDEDITLHYKHVSDEAVDEVESQEEVWKCRKKGCKGFGKEFQFKSELDKHEG